MKKNFSCIVSKGEPIPKDSGRAGHVGGFIEEKPIIFGGTRFNENKIQKYYLNNSLFFAGNQWVEGPFLPVPLAYSMYAYDNSGIYVAGGTSDGTSMLTDVYRLVSIQKGSKWEKLPDLPEAVGFGAGAIIDGKFYISGGTLNNGEKTNRMWRLDLKEIESGWTESKPIPGTPRNLHALTACGECLFLIGGLADSSILTPLDDLYKFDYKRNSWERLDNLPCKGYAWVAQPIDNTHILITGRADGQIHKDIRILDLETMSMNKIGNLKTSSTTAPLIKLSDNEWWLVSGEPDANKNRTDIVNVIKLQNDVDDDIKIMSRTAADNKYLHKDFHQSMNLLMDYIYNNFGKERLIQYLKQFTKTYHQPLQESLQSGDINVLVDYFSDVYEKEEWPVRIEIKEDCLEIEQDGCPGISHIKSMGQVPTPLYIETYRTVYTTLCESTPFEYTLVCFDNETGACKQLFSKRKA